MTQKYIKKRFPITEVLFTILGGPIIFIILLFFSSILVLLYSTILNLILYKHFSFAYELFVISGRAGLIYNSAIDITAIVYTVILIIAGLEGIAIIKSKKQKENLDYDEKIDLAKKIIFNKTDNSI